MSFRIKLSIAIAVLLGIVLTLATTLFLGMQRAEYHFQRSHLAHGAAQAYVDLSNHAYRHFKELLDRIALNGDAGTSLEHAQLTQRQLFAAVERVRASIQTEIGHIEAAAGGEDEAEELAQLAEIERLLQHVIWRLERVQVLSNVNAERSAREMLSTTLEETIDRQFKSMIDSAIAEEMREVTWAAEHAEGLMRELRWTAMTTAVLATALALAMGWLLWRNLSEPLNKLVLGVREVARGDLEHRITLPGRNEFTYLAKNFNQMTEQLARQRAELLNAQTGLERQVELRTRELQQANDKLSYLDEARRRFLADISHELRTPLTAIRGEAEVTLRGREKQSDEYRTALRRIIDLSAQLAKLVEDLLFLARSETASVRFEIRPVVLDQLAAAICEEAGALAQTKQLALNLELPNTSITVRGDPLRLRQLLLILIDNACRYTPRGGAITVTLGVESGYASLSVADQGIGITEEELAQVFERHFRGERARRAVPSGSGLGLPLAKAIVEAHQGSITLASTPDHGTSVTVKLPLPAQEEN